MDHKLKSNLKYIVLAAGFIISAAFYVKSGIPDKIKLENESKGVYLEDYSEDIESAVAEDIEGKINLSEDNAGELLDQEKKLIKEYVRELLGEYTEAERVRKEYDREHAEILKKFSGYKSNKAVLEDGTGQDDDISSDKININTAGLGELMQIKGIGEKKAEDILCYREEHGAFLSIEELKEIKGIKASLYENIKDFITV